MPDRHPRRRPPAALAAALATCLLLLGACADLPAPDEAAAPPAAPSGDAAGEQAGGDATVDPSEPAAPGPGTAVEPDTAEEPDEGATQEPAAPEPEAAGDPVWSDEFDGAEGSPPDPANWQLETGGEGWGNNERQYYTDSTDNAALDGDGHLVVTAREGNPEGFTCWYGPCTHTSARMNTAGRFAQQYGRIEARIRIPTGQGVWPAFWMLGDDFGDVGWPASGEIDVMENVGHEPGIVHGTVHGPGYSGGDGIGGSTTLPDGASFSDDFHVYAVEWTPEQITWLVDDVAYHAVTPDDLGGNAWVFDHPFFLILNVAVGGDWPGDPDATTSFPQEMVVDYVRVRDLDAG